MLESPKIGAYVLETLTTGMYTNPLDSIREYVQNATDSLLEFEARSARRNEGRIDARIDPVKRTLVIKDNGTGIPSKDVPNRLINIGMSDKDLRHKAGFRGIGRLAGIAYCDRLTFRTAAVGEGIVSIVEIDCVSLRRSLAPAMRQVEELAEVMVRNCSLHQEPTSTDRHFFEVVIEGVKPEAEIFLDWKALEDYLSQVAPVRFDAQRFLLATKIKEWVEKNNVPLPTVTLVIETPDTCREVFKPYRGHYKTKHVRGGNLDFQVKDVLFYPEMFRVDSPFWLWYARTDLLGTIEDEKSAGLRLRSKNIAIGGPERVAELFGEKASTDSRFNGWYIGEIHILSPDAIPNARRDGFEETGAWPQIKAELVPFFRSRIHEIRQQSDTRNQPTAKLVRGAQEAIDEATQRLETGFISKTQLDETIKQLEKNETSLQQAVQAKSGSKDAIELENLARKVVKIKERLVCEANFVTQKLPSTLDRKQRKLVSEILQTLYEALDKENYAKAEKAICAKFSVRSSDLKT